MDMLWSLVSRHNKVFLRDRMHVFFSLLTVFITIALYAIFLQKIQLDAIEQLIPMTDAIKLMVTEWMIAGLLSILSVTTTLGVFAIYIRDVETKTTGDFLTTSASRFKIQLSYVVSSLFIGFSISLFAFICCQAFVVSLGGDILSVRALLKVIGILALSVLLSSSINLVIVLFIKTQTAFSALSTLIGTVIGFLCGVYVPIGALPSYVQSIIHFFPVSHTTVLLRQVIMNDSMQEVFQGNQVAAQDYQLLYGVTYKINDTIISSMTSLLFIVSTIIVIGIIAFVIFSRKHK